MVIHDLLCFEKMGLIGPTGEEYVGFKFEKLQKTYDDYKSGKAVFKRNNQVFPKSFIARQ